MMLARSMQADIRSNNTRLQRFGKDVKNEGSPKPQIRVTTNLIASTEKHDAPMLDYFDILKDNNIMNASMAWITDVFHVK